MAATYRLDLSRRLVNAAMRVLVPMGLAPRRYVLLTVRGRRSGMALTTPVIVLEMAGERWLVAPYGETAWVRNARAAGQVTLSRRGYRETVAIEVVGPDEAGPVLKRYLTETPITRPFFDAGPESPPAEFAREAAWHPVFLLARSSGEA